MNIEVVYSPAPGTIDLVVLHLQEGATAADALVASGLLERHALQADAVRIGIWSKPCVPQVQLRERDRLEIYRPLLVDPMEARRLRQQRQRPDKPVKPRR